MQNSWLYIWLQKMIGDDGATAIWTTITIVINAIVVYVVVLSVFRLLKAIERKNSEDPKERAEAVTSIKNTIIVIVLIVLLGAVGFNVVLNLSGSLFNMFPNDN